ncbi:glyoxylate/hydroxypyruvate reductase A [Defluviimonas sp. WL0002]|uniref:Glyoxylate/hydroxypyruvate reductase A n=1 Tax=Albidovulum marisflavi TaxID=2984159 RepID=A0ABT2ZCF8_9RHOB|nr:glyoxylate/hydroxypyruvate reductase A [Defluviimonas sp. WL0002]MCV2868814.1 glyoxylate/hydroxypyruvate reductase A [Defluviimonas sp. WL0002]
MATNVFFAAGAKLWPEYREAIQAACAKKGLSISLSDAAPDPAAVDYIVYAPTAALSDFTPFTRCKAVLSLWAGVERIAPNPTLTQPLCRMVDSGLTEGMVEWVTGHVLRHHLGMDAHITGQDGIWRHDSKPPLARDRRVTILGLGELGTACAKALSALNFPVTGWSRTQKHIDGIACLSGDEGLEEALARADILVTLLPRTTATENLMSAERFALMPRGSFLINPGRGQLIDDDALLAALGSGRIAHATLDVFRVEPLPPDHPFWAHPGVTVTPHLAADTRTATAAEVIVENIRRGETGEPLLYLVNRDLGY